MNGKAVIRKPGIRTVIIKDSHIIVCREDGERGIEILGFSERDIARGRALDVDTEIIRFVCDAGDVDIAEIKLQRDRLMDILYFIDHRMCSSFV